MEIGKFTTSSGATFEIVEIVKNTSLNTFTGEKTMYRVNWTGASTRVFSLLGIHNIIKYQ